jgi:phospholipid/cholesterol/gamma-HCH transport system substrate-binding protein
MYASRFTQFVVGLFALLGIAALVYLSVRLGNVGILPTPGYTLYANFDNISGLKTADPVQIAGVIVGKVQSISLQNDRAHVGLRVNNGVEVDTDAIASVKTSGIIGDKYISIQLGGGEKNFGEGGTILKTESAFVLEDAIGKLINNSGGGGSSSSGAAPPSPGGGQAASGGNQLPGLGNSSSTNNGNCKCSGQSGNKK